MKHTYKDIEGSRREFLIEIPSHQVAKELDRIYKEMEETVHIPGFRKGRVPRDILEKYHRKDAQERALSDMVSSSYREAVRESDTIPVSLPKISDIKFKEGDSLSYKATVDIKPKVNLKRYKNIKVKKRLIEIKDEDVQKYLSALRESYAEYKSIEDRPARFGDYLVCDILCEVDGKPLYKEQKNVWLFLDEKHPIPKLAEGLIGVKKGEEKNIKALLPEDKDNPKYSKKEASFRVKVNQIKEKHLPEIDDEFVKGLGTYENVLQLKEAAKKDLERKSENRSKADMSSQILEELLKNSSFLPPKGLLEEETERLVQEAKEELRRKNVKNEEIEKRIKEYQKDFEKEAIRKVRLYFILDEIAKIENIDVTETEIEEALSLLSQQSNMSLEEVKKYYKDNNLIPSLRNQLKESKTIEFLLNNADIKEA